MSISSWQNFSAKSLREIIQLPCKLVVQGDFDVRLALTLKTKKKYTRDLGLQSIFISKGENYNLDIKLHGPAAIFICLDSTSLFDCNKLMK